MFRAVWQLVDGILLSIWMLATGWLVRPWQAGFAGLSLILGGLFAVGAGLTALDLGAARDVGLGIVFVLWVVWSVWLAVLIWQRRLPFHDLDAAGAMPARDTRLDP